MAEKKKAKSTTKAAPKKGKAMAEAQTKPKAFKPAPQPAAQNSVS